MTALAAIPSVAASGWRIETQALLARYCSVRQQSLKLCEPLTPEDMMVQSCPEASPAKWHMAHTTWFFETFILREFSPGYQPFHADFLWLFNSYYNGVSAQPEKKLRASFSRPSLEQIFGYRQHVDAAIEAVFAGDAPDEAARRLELGLHHEQQHQELLVTDIKHALWSNPMRPAYRDMPLPPAGATSQLTPQRWRTYPGGVVEIGYSGTGFCFDNEEPRHRVYLEPFALATRPVSCAEYLQFMEDDGYRRAELWLAEGWRVVEQEHWEAPLYWHRHENDAAAQAWQVFTLRGEQPLNALLAAPVCHLSYFEADAFARWAGCRLPTEAEWEIAAADTLATTPLEAAGGDLLEGDTLHPLAGHSASGEQTQLSQMLGGVWEWTASAYLGYPGYRALPGALGEYNGKFMSGQMVLRGGSVATPASHIRATYRNFFAPGTRWQFSGVRLARR